MEVGYRDIDITVTLANEYNGHALSFEENGINTLIPIAFATLGFNLQVLTVRSLLEKLDNNGNIAAPTMPQDQPYGSDVFNELYDYDLENATGKFRELAAKMCLNASLSNHFSDPNIVCFNKNKDYVFFQPVIFDLSSTIDTVSVTKRNGEGSIRYKLDEGEWGESNMFSDLQPNTEYQVYAKTLEDEYVTNYSIFTKELFRLSATNSTITVALVDQTGSFEYSKDGQEWQTENTFTGLNPETQYDIYVKVLATGKTFKQKITTAK